METVLNVFSDGAPGRRLVVVCVQRVALTSPVASLLGEPLASQLLEGPFVEAWIAPMKSSADVVLARAPVDDSTRAWIEDSGSRDLRAIGQPFLGPTAAHRWRHLMNHAAQRWAAAGGLRAVGARRQNGKWMSQPCPVPPGVPPEYFNVAPLEQQLPRLSGTEAVWIDSPTGRRSSRLPGVELAVWAIDTTPPELVPMRLDTVVVDPESLEAALFWRGSFVRPDGASLPGIVVDVLHAGAERPAAPRPSASSRPALEPMPTAEIALNDAAFNEATGQVVEVADAALPFKTSTPPRPAQDDHWEYAPDVQIARPARLRSLKSDFGESDDPWLHETQNTAATPSEVSDAALPFRGKGVPDAPPTPSFVAPVPLAPLAVERPAFQVLPRPSFEISRIDAERRALEEPALVSSFSIDEQADVEAAPSTEPRGPAEVTIELVAAVDVELQLAPSTGQATLEAHGLSLPDFAARRTTWVDAIAADSKQGRRDLQRRYDTAYLARVEELRGRPISTEEYGRIVVSLERLNAPELLAELGLPPRSQLVVTRVFSERSARSPALRREISDSVHKARDGV